MDISLSRFKVSQFLYSFLWFVLGENGRVDVYIWGFSVSPLALMSSLYPCH